MLVNKNPLKKKKINQIIFAKSGMWILQKWRKSSSLSQLSMTDAKDIEDTFLYKLSRAPVNLLFIKAIYIYLYAKRAWDGLKISFF
jgi:hypothetical protein